MIDQDIVIAAIEEAQPILAETGLRAPIAGCDDRPAPVRAGSAMSFRR
jgi:hypothetical protein